MLNLFLKVFFTIFVAELGDKTQLGVFGFAANNPKAKWIIFLASVVALGLSSFIAVFFGEAVAKFISPKLLTKLSGALFIILGILIFIKG